MASTDRRSTRNLDEEIRTDCFRFRFFQAVRLLALSSCRTGDPEPIPSTLRFNSELSLTFPASDITAIAFRLKNAPHANRDGVDERAKALTAAPDMAPSTCDILEMMVGFMGLTGPSGVLPRPYTELFIDQRNRFRDDSGQQFLNLFNHRAVSLFYRAWRKHRFYLGYEAGNFDGFSRNLLDLVGIGLNHLQQRLQRKSGRGIPDRFLVHYAGILSQRPISAANIATLVKGYFAVDAKIESFVGQWIDIPSFEQSAMDDRVCCLGQNAFVGERLWDRQNKIRVRLGPLDKDQFSQFMPGQSALFALRELIQFCVGLALDCEVALVLKSDAVPFPVLSRDQASQPKLGYNLWLNSLMPSCDVDDVHFLLLGNKATLEQ